MEVRPIVGLEGTTGGKKATSSSSGITDTNDIDYTLQLLKDGDERGAKKSQAKKAMAIVEESCSELFLDQFGTPYAH